MRNLSCHGKDGNTCGCGGHGRFINPRLLLLLNKKSSYGYELIAELKKSSSPNLPFDVGAVYRGLREMEKNKLVSSSWAKGGKGPAKRVYKITKNGKQTLKEWEEIIKERKKSLEKLLNLFKKGGQTC